MSKITVFIYIFTYFQRFKTIEYIYKNEKGIMYTTSNTTVCLKLAKLNLLLYTGGYYEWL